MGIVGSTSLSDVQRHRVGIRVYSQPRLFDDTANAESMVCTSNCMHPYSACVLGVLYKCLNSVNAKRYSLPLSEVSSGWCAVFCDIHTAQW